MSDTQIPATMKRLVVASAGKDITSCKIEIEEIPVPEPGSGEVLIRVAAAAINPSDYGSWIRAKPHQLPYAMGKEGSGIIVAKGSGIAARTVSVGSKVGFVGLKRKQGAYSEYVAASVLESVFSLPEDLPVEDGASFFVNPYTAVAILDTVRREGAHAFVHTAAASQLGQMMVELAKSDDVEVVNVVRREEQAEMLRGRGARHVVVTGGDDSWKEVLRHKIGEVRATVAFDAVAGRMTADLLDVMPKGGTVYVYGALAGPVENVDPMALIYHDKKIKGFLLNNWLTHGGMLGMMPRLLAASRKVNSGLNGGWSASQFKDTTLEKAHHDIVQLLATSITAHKLRIRFDSFKQSSPTANDSQE